MKFQLYSDSLKSQKIELNKKNGPFILLPPDARGNKFKMIIFLWMLMK
jgi:hypothetical protein